MLTRQLCFFQYKTTTKRRVSDWSSDLCSSVLIGIALVLSAVLLPMAFFGGSTGVIYRQFSITIVSSMLLSVVVALILSPALCATILKPVSHEHRDRGWTGRFNRWFGRVTDGYKIGRAPCRERGCRHV